MLFQRFSDAPTERAYRRSERVARGPAIRALILIAIATLLFYLIINPMHFPREGVLAYTAAAVAFILVLMGFYALSKSDFYLDHGWIDAPIFAVIFVAMAAHPHRSGRRRRHRQQSPVLRLLGRHDEYRQPPAGRRAAKRHRRFRGHFFQTRSMQDYDPQTVVLKGIGETQIYVARL